MFIDDLKGFQKEVSATALAKSQSQPNLIIKQEIKVEPIIHSGETKGKKRPKVEINDKIIPNVKKNKSL